MLDLKATKKVTIGENQYEIGKVPMRMFGVAQASIDAYGADAMNAVYNYLPYFIESATVDGDTMKKTEIIELWPDVKCRMADEAWINTYIPPEDAFNLMKECVTYNQLTGEQEKN